MTALPQGWGKAVKQSKNFQMQIYKKIKIIFPFQYSKNV